MPLEARVTLGVLWVVFFLLVAPRPLLAQSRATSESHCSELEQLAEGSGDPIQIEWAGQIGMFFPMATARLILCEVRELRLRRGESQVNDRLIESWRLQVEFTERQRDLAVQARDQLMSVVELAERRARDSEDRIGAWYRSPVFLVAVGVVLTVGIYFAASYGLRAIHSD